MQCQAALQVRVHSTTVVRFRYPRRSGLAELFVLCEGTILADDDVKTARYQYDLLGRGTVLSGYYYLSVPFRSLPRLFLCTLRRHRYRLLRQRLFSLAPSRVVVVSGIVFQYTFTTKRGTFYLVGSGRAWFGRPPRANNPVAGVAEETTRRARAHPEACSIIAEREKRLHVFSSVRVSTFLHEPGAAAA